MQITSIEKHAGSDIWHGVATEGADHYQWFWDEDSPLPLKMRQQDQRNPRCWMNVDPPAGGPANRPEGDSGGAIMSENWHKRHALSLAAQLPENASDANAIIRELQHLVDTWLHVAPEPAPSKVFSLVRES